ncbi:MAG: thiolase family protein [Chloroflexota bacterium]
MKEVVLVGGVRTPIGAHGGALKDVAAHELAKIVMQEVLKRTQVDPAGLEEVIFGCCMQTSDAPNMARVASLNAGIPKEVTGFTVQRNCASGLQAITSAYEGIQVNHGDSYLVGGAESMSSAPYMVRGARWGLKLRHTQFIDVLWEGLTDPVVNQIMGRTAENLADMYNISREEQDQFAVESHKKAFMATRTGKFKDEIVPVMVAKRVAGKEVASEPITQDECINPAISVQKLALYPTVFKENGTVTPGNACPISDGAAALLVMTADRAKSLGLEIMGYIRAYAYGGVGPEVMGIGPTVAVPKALKRAGLKLTDIDLIELNEAFAAQCLAVGKVLKDDGWDWNKVNVNGGAIALGHPVGCSGARIAVTLLHEMKKRGLHFGLATMCVGGGQGGAIVVERK